MDYAPVIRAALGELEQAVADMLRATEPNTPLPRPKFFRITARHSWPYIVGSRVDFNFVRGDPHWYLLSVEKDSLTKNILTACGYQPRLILRALRRIQAATAWCLARAEGRKRAAQEILRQQAKAVEALEAEKTLYALRRG